MSLRRRLRNLENSHPASLGSEEEREKRLAEERRRVREQAEHSNRCGEGRGEAPFFEVSENGDVFGARDGRPVTDTRQTLAEVFYWREVEEGWAGLVHDEEAQAFYTPGGEPALSRDLVHLGRLIGRGRDYGTPGEFLDAPHEGGGGRR